MPLNINQVDNGAPKNIVQLVVLAKWDSLISLLPGGFPRHTYMETENVHTLDGFVGCVRNLQINGNEIDVSTAAFKSRNIDNCNVPVCQHSPCENGGTCHR